MTTWSKCSWLCGVVYLCTVLMVALPESAMAQQQCKGKQKNDPGCGGSGGDASGPIYDVAVIGDSGLGESFCSTPLFNPGALDPPILATTPDQSGSGIAYLAIFPRHLSDGGPTLTMDTGAQLADDLRIVIGTNEFGQIVSVQVTGQPEDGKQALAHESEVVQLAQSVTPLIDQPFYVHVDTDHIPVWRLSRHLGGKREQIVGEFCLGDMLYIPRP